MFTNWSTGIWWRSRAVRWQGKRPFILGNQLGKLYSELTIQCFPHKRSQVRRPDLAFFATARLPLVPREGHVRIAPDLAIEIISPNDTVYDLDSKLTDYQAAVIPLTWVINPEQRHVRVYKSGRFAAELGETEELTGNSVVHGFAVRVAELFPQQ